MNQSDFTELHAPNSLLFVPSVIFGRGGWRLSVRMQKFDELKKNRKSRNSPKQNTDRAEKLIRAGTRTVILQPGV